MTAFLKPAWRRWKSGRVKEMVAAGLSGDTAKQVARQEALARQRVSPIIGYSAAKAAGLVAIAGETPRFAVVGTTDDLTTDQLDRLQLSGARLALT